MRSPARTRAGRRPLEQIPMWWASAPPAAPTEDPGLTALLGGLNPEQRRAVTHDRGPLLVVAGAGTGKTEVITRRIAWLIATRRAKPSEVLALTFTDKAAGEMAIRVDQLVPYGYTDTAISTFHAFGDRVVREFALEAGLPDDPRVLSRAEVVLFLRERLFDLDLDRYRPLGDPTRFLAALADHISRCKDEGIEPARAIDHATERLRSAVARRDGRQGEDDHDAALLAEIDAATGEVELARAFARYQDLMTAAGYLDFGDQVARAVRLIRTVPTVREILRARYRYVLVDEFQDTNRSQAELVTALVDGHRNLTVVGDDDQSIYRFRGAAIGNILDFRDRYRGARLIVLRRNYRSLAPVLDAARRLIVHNDPDRLEVRAGISKRLIAMRRTAVPAPVRHVAFATGSEEADWIGAEIRRRIEAGARPRDHAVLVRTNAAADPILRSLTVAGIPWLFPGAAGLYATPEVRRLLAALRAVADPGSSPDVYALAASEAYRLGGADLTAIVAAARRRNRTVWEVATELISQPGLLRLSPESRTALERFVSDVTRWIDLGHHRPTGEVLYAILRESGLLARWSSAGTVAAADGLRNVARFFDIVRQRSELVADPRPAFVVPHLGELLEAGDDPATVDLDPDADGVSVLTVHRAKGLEFPVVFVAGLVAGRFPAVGRREALPIPDGLVGEAPTVGDPVLAEERRLFYVALTRARDELILTHAADYGGARLRRVSPFVLEALDRPVATDRPAATDGRGSDGRGSDGRGSDEHPDGDPSSTSTPSAPKAIERIDRFAARPPLAVTPSGDRVDGPLTLSYGAIDAYLTCPARYRYGHLLRIPVAPHHALVYGAALHAAVQAFHRRQARADPMTEAELLAAFDEAWTNEGFVSREHEEARHAAGADALRRFRSDQLGPDAVVPTYVEREFTFFLDGNRIRGRWDRVDIEPIDPMAAAAAPSVGPGRPGLADIVEPSLPLLPTERVTITDYKSGDVRDATTARRRVRDSLQLSIYAMAYEALTGRLPDLVQLWFLDTGVVAGTQPDLQRLERARAQIGTVAAGIRAAEFAARPDPIVCGHCPYRDICPDSAAA